MIRVSDANAEMARWTARVDTFVRSLMMERARASCHKHM
ncbi:hypothetical protein QBC99_003591 [Beijerinckia sp. GAS462]|nr:hypothetical protein [Beijerinckia sp. GAS462]SEC89254.1 hypothetical protein SAMN05443249_3822 [Beijerinckia sp. 28-YEA-48]